MKMKTFVIDIPDPIYYRGVKFAKQHGITFSEVCELGVMELMGRSRSEEEPREMIPQEEDRSSDV
jgi:hypothetical protein